jgi:uroporphyrinogen decarboxylase
VEKNRKPFFKVLRGQNVDRNPIWLMRQAGRYLPEYRKLRLKVRNFQDLCLNPKLAFEVTKQPIDRFGMDAAILFSDILMVPKALGLDLEYEEKSGPKIEKISEESQLAKLKYNEKILDPVYETVSLMKNGLPSETVRIGFCGGLWTVACYILEGHGKTGFEEAVKATKEKQVLLLKLTDILYEATFEYLSKQIDAGAEAIQIFDSWSGLLSGKEFRKWIIEPTKKLVKALEEKYPEVPVIGYPRLASEADYCAFVNETGVDALSIDEKISLSFAEKDLRSVKPLQGNLDPKILVEGGIKMQKAVEKILETFGPNHVFNLGHGVLPETPVENVAELVQLVREAEWQK